MAKAKGKTKAKPAARRATRAAPRRKAAAKAAEGGAEPRPITLSTLRPPKGSTHARLRVGRGPQRRIRTRQRLQSAP